MNKEESRQLCSNHFCRAVRRRHRQTKNIKIQMRNANFPGRYYSSSVVFYNRLCSTFCHRDAFCASTRIYCLNTKTPSSHDQTVITTKQLDSFTRFGSMRTHLSVYLTPARDPSTQRCPVMILLLVVYQSFFFVYYEPSI